MLTPGRPMPTATCAVLAVIEQSNINSTMNTLRMFYPHDRPVAVFLMIGEILAHASAVAGSSVSGFLRCSRRTLSNVLERSVLKLAVYRNEGSRIDFIGLTSSGNRRRRIVRSGR